MNKVSKEKVELYEVVRPLLHSAYSEVKVMSGKKQSEQLNLNKVKIINKLLDKVLILLKDEPTIEFLQKLDEDDLPTNSDAVLILSQSLSAMDQFHSKYFHSDEWEAFRTGKWQTEDDEEE
ncbi:Uncharacterised protein [uncultured Prevotella sp.]|uniref:Uncharacterized protein n=2 Tax=Bacteroidales TaxID=171549 RepID=A0A379EEX9_9BACT|nr:Uncharacterised protein [Prevotella denticola]VTY01996.1 Uncharacterised protein [uncultured Prevotella sp.]